VKGYALVSLVAALALLPVAAAAQQGQQGQRGRSSPSKTPPPEEQAPRPAEPQQPDRVIEIMATAKGFSPAAVTARLGERVRLIVRRGTDAGAPGEFILDEFLVWRRLSPRDTVVENFKTGRTGEFPYHSQDGKHSGVFKVE
jgi:hypothetical protein